MVLVLYLLHDQLLFISQSIYFFRLGRCVSFSASRRFTDCCQFFCCRRAHGYSHLQRSIGNPLPGSILPRCRVSHKLNSLHSSRTFLGHQRYFCGNFNQYAFYFSLDRSPRSVPLRLSKIPKVLLAEKHQISFSRRFQFCLDFPVLPSL